ncbi:hypothetical protein [Aminobacter sp. AP02]|uniref:hypothetical protein n=1 Tax=Aminobacter sp. AP02 TaxID=2135737 RepID=UPI000D6D25A6|nr:hypothetical protein [Aminobacter sp. AP02]PWK59441.1 hypothetical protein C8K44_1442 [Aminobacter sp. AP02]
MAYQGYFSRSLPAHGFSGWLIERTATLFVEIKRQYQLVRSRRELEALSIHQQKDIGYPVLDDPRPMLDVKAGVMSKLMTMR